MCTNNCNKMTVWSIIIIPIAASVGSVVMVQEKVCSSFCSSLGMLESSPRKSCDKIYQINKTTRGMSHLYWINTTSGVQEVYCNMELQYSGYKGGWTRVVKFNQDFKTHDSESRGQEEAAVRDERVNRYLHVAPL